MLLTIRQTKANGQNLFQAEENGQVLFQARTPWANLRLPLEGENMRRLTFSDAQGREIYHTSYRLLDNALRSLSKYKFLLGTSAKVEEYQVLDENGEEQGAFYTQIDGVLTSQQTICYGKEQYDCYPRAMGKIYVVSIFQEGRQIAQITKPLDTWDQLDLYYLHLLDSFRRLLPILCFFTVYLDAMFFTQPGRAVKYSVEKHRAYSFNKNNDKYDPHWIAQAFGPQAQEELDRLLREHPEKNPQSVAGLKRAWKWAAILAAALLLITAGAIWAFSTFFSASPLLPQEFTRQMEERGYTLSDLSSGYAGAGAEAAWEGTLGECCIQFLSFPEESQARQFFAAQQAQLSPLTADSHTRSTSSSNHKEKQAFSTDDNFYALSRLKNTVLLCSAPAEQEDLAKDTLKELGY